MATYSTGISVVWNGTPFTEVQELSWSSGGTRAGRDIAWTPDQGTVAIACLGTANAAASNFGTRAMLVISGGSADLISYATWESVNVAPERNGVTKYTVTLKLLDDV